MTQPERRKLKAPAIALATLLLGGCATMTASSAPSECARWRPISWADADTDETIRAVKEHNAVWIALCRN